MTAVRPSTGRPGHRAETPREVPPPQDNPTTSDRHEGQTPLRPFAELNDEERAEVASCVREVEVAAGATLATQGDNAYEFFVIESGEAEVRRRGELIASLRPGDVFGEIGLLVTGTRTASVVALTPMKLVAMFSREFKRIEGRMPAIADTLRATMRERVAQAPLHGPRT
jgi:CRP/FNR family transcriptional regulator, cyclic AMP receptor protein